MGNNGASKRQSYRLPIPRTPPGWRKTGNLLFDLNKMYGQAALENPNVRTMLRREYNGRIEIKRIDGRWQIVSN
jgi:hypothetical protein